MLKLGEGRVHQVPVPLQAQAAEAAAKMAQVRAGKAEASPAIAQGQRAQPPQPPAGETHWLWQRKRGVDVPEPPRPVYEHETKVNGVTKSGYAFETLRLGQAVRVVPDPFGRVVHPNTGHDDANALSIQDEDGVHIGYVPRPTAAVFSPRIRSSEIEMTAYVAEILGGVDGLNYGVVVNLVYTLTAEAMKAERKVQKEALQKGQKGKKRA